MIYNKLVRDKIPEIIASCGEKAHIRTLEAAEYALCLEKKLDEEVAEYHESHALEELADILEVLFALAEAGGHSKTELMAACDAKREKRGGFSQRVFLLEKE